LINSPGGEVPSAFAIIDAIQGSKIPVHTTGLGIIASSGLMIFIAGKKGHRIMTPNTSILSHQFSGGHQGKQHELVAGIKYVNFLEDRMISHYKKWTGLSEADIKKYLLPSEDVWLNSKEALKYKLCDKVVREL
jgi:ATP-dependent Clp protease protease subunit